MEKSEERYIEELAVSVGRKLRAKDYDKFGILGKDLEFTRDELVLYKYTLLEASKHERDLGIHRYFEGEGLTNEEVMEQIGLSHGTYYKVRKIYLEGIYAMLSYVEYEPVEVEGI